MTAVSPSPYRDALRSLRRGLMMTAGLSAIISVLMLTGSIYMLQVYDRVLSSGSVPTLMALFAIVVMLYSFLVVFDGLRMRLLSRLALQLDDRLSGLTFRADLATARAGTPGSLGRDLEVLRGFLAGPATLALFDLPFTLLFVGVLFVIHPILGWLTLGGMALAAALAAVNRLVLKAPTANAHLPDLARQRLAEAARRGAATVAALGMERHVLGRWLGHHRQTLGHQQKGAEPSETLSALSRGLRMLLQSALLTAGAWLVIGGAISAGAIVAASILSGRALGPVDQLIGQWRSLTQARAAHDRLAQLQAPAPAVMSLPALTGALEVQDLTCFAPKREDGAAPAKLLDGVSFTLAAGEGLGLVGASASGKSTLARAIVGALRADSGDIRFDGASLRHWDPDRLGRQIGYLPQRIDLMPGSLRDNIARFDPQATDAGVIAAAQAAGVHDMILRLPGGYATDLSQSDLPLSGGQIQRIGLARALYGDPRLLVLDEPNAHLDMAGEAALIRTLTALRATGVTVIVMAHRAGALAAVDRLMVIEDGRILQDGPRDAVLTNLGGARTAPSPTVPAKLTVRALPPRTAPGQGTGAAGQKSTVSAQSTRAMLFRVLQQKSAS
ncbi:MAG: type I secretion system permease/ATPase [Pseudotabrizicola sp.]|uniref:type I secretion system permease/ATPase n=1 Tax=Pseudotabrizicola sp. TaxID=2939647 RepID=UPI0027159D5B|nr:type I secretion system permease/ATPase [Pseudotabrizicola sp.]MDO9640867.1 type I secretion system permease/ATPase [Pseudotabrizicola sp.]